MTNLIKEMLLIEEPSVFRLYREVVQMAGYFVGPLFIIGLLVEFLGNLDFAGVVKRLLIVMVVLTSFYGIHTKSVDISLDLANKTLKRVSPRNLFIRKWTEQKVVTKQKTGWGYIEKFAIPNLNDMLATAFFLMAKVFTWILKLIYSSVYHLTYIFSGITALLYFFGWTNRSLIGTFQSSLWCIILPFVIVAILAMVGNSIDQHVVNGTLAIADIETILWLFGVMLILMLSPVITWSMVKGDGVAGAGSKMGAMAVSTGMKAMYMVPLLYSKSKTAKNIASKSFSRAKNIINRNSPQNQYMEMRKNGDVGKDTFFYDKKYWNKLSDKHKEGIREKYGIQASKPEKNMVYHTAKSGVAPIEFNKLKEIQKSSKDNSSKLIKTQNKDFRISKERNTVQKNRVATSERDTKSMKTLLKTPRSPERFKRRTK